MAVEENDRQQIMAGDRAMRTGGQDVGRDELDVCQGEGMSYARVATEFDGPTCAVVLDYDCRTCGTPCPKQHSGPGQPETEDSDHKNPPGPVVRPAPHVSHESRHG